MTVLLWLGFLTRQRLPYFFDGDGVNYGLSLFDYNLFLNQPHPPGDPLYVALARVFLSLFKDPVLSLWLVSFLGYLGTLFVIWLLLERGIEIRMAALSLVATSPLFVKYALVVNPDIWEGLIFLQALYLWEARQTAIAFFLLGFSLGFRLTMVYYLSFFLVVMLGKSLRQKNWKNPFAFACGVLLWFVPFLEAAGGISRFAMALTLRESLLRFSVFVEGTPALARNTSCLGRGLLFGLGGAVFLLPFSLSAFRKKAIPLLVLLLPGLLYLILVLCNVSAYLIGATVLSIALFARQWQKAPWMVAIPAVFNLFLLFSLVFPGLKQVEDFWRQRVACVRKTFPPLKSVLYFEQHRDPERLSFYRHAVFYLPEYLTLYLLPGRKKSWWLSHRRKTRVYKNLPERLLEGKILVYGNQGEGKGKTVYCHGQSFHIGEL